MAHFRRMGKEGKVLSVRLGQWTFIGAHARVLYVGQVYTQYMHVVPSAVCNV